VEPIELTAEEKELKEKLEKGVEELRRFYANYHTASITSLSKDLTSLGKIGHELHMLLKKRGINPKHHGYMIENRGMPADDPRFYEHLHPLEDLLAFLEDPSANDDPVDQTIGETFKFTVTSRRWGHDDTYLMTRTETGWDVKFLTIGGSCDRSGRPYLFEILRHDSISYPEDLDMWIAWLWNQAREKGLSREDVQRALNELASWVKLVETEAPRGWIWSELK
jgi:hypothetical protein